MRDHIRVLGILNIVMGALIALIGVFIFFVTGTIAGYIASSINTSAHDKVVAAPLVAAMGLAVAIFFWVLALPAVIGGWGLFHLKSWSWLLMVIVSVLHLFHFPIGTALGVYGLWVLFNDEARRLLEKRSIGYGVPPSGLQPPSPPTYSSHPPRPV